ncbi:MAG: hypothetical protein PHW80_08860 [Smithellaceae bacterium]|jgi:hypothetical protein|nr:hypothetical protein [Smithellaceae bacterium]MDD3259660.1 hypothetical protein [Smithellaceae bacterium]MDD3849397.1 hypothetical protein [Smithellaceae bacterium]HOG12979.1 hypothetical protein [Smithellaceae bacterium]HOQ71874.1 hypothetical protein [Smithellaceae bacterium]
MLKDYQEKILELLEELELNMCNLYLLFADRFPKYRDLWADISRQETSHADGIKKLHLLAGEDRVLFDEKLTKTYTVKMFITSIQEAQTRTKSGKMSLINALSVSHDFEQAVLEKGFYNFFSGQDDETRTVIRQIKEETLDHQMKMKNAWEQERKSAGP